MPRVGPTDGRRPGLAEQPRRGREPPGHTRRAHVDRMRSGGARQHWDGSAAHGWTIGQVGTWFVVDGCILGHRPWRHVSESLPPELQPNSVPVAGPSAPDRKNIRELVPHPCSSHAPGRPDPLPRTAMHSLAPLCMARQRGGRSRQALAQALSIAGTRVRLKNRRPDLQESCHANSRAGTAEWETIEGGTR